MKTTPAKQIIVFLLSLASFFAIPFHLPAQGGGFYINGQASYMFIFGKMNGEDALVGDNDIFLLPRFKGGLGYGGSVGFMGKDSTHLMGLRYERATFQATYQEEALGKATYNYVGMEHSFFIPADFLPLMNGRPVLKFYATGGVGVGFMNIPDGHLSLSGFKRDATLTSVALPFGGGMLFQPWRPVALHLGIVYKFAFLIRAQSEQAGSQNFEISSTTGTGGLMFNTGLWFVFGK